MRACASLKPRCIPACNVTPTCCLLLSYLNALNFILFRATSSIDFDSSVIMLGVQSLAVLVPLCLLLGFVLYLLYGLGSNYLTARRTGLSLIVLPFDCGNPLWLIIDRKVAQFVRRLPFGAGNFTRFNWRGWEIWDRYRAHQELGEAILFVTPGELYLQLCDPEAVGDVLRRRDDFPRPPEATGKYRIQ